MGIDNAVAKQQNFTYSRLHLYWEFHDLRLSAAEQMEGELPSHVESRNFRDTAGPAESQLYLDESIDDREDDRVG